MQAEGDLHIPCSLGTASRQEGAAGSHLESGQQSSYCSCCPVLGQRGTGGSLGRGDTPTAFRDFSGQLGIT